MTVELSPYCPPNAVAFMLAHLQPLGACDLTRTDDDPLPFRQVNRIDGADDLYEFCDNAVLSVHTFAESISAVHREADITHRRILLLATDPVNVPLASGGFADASGLVVQQRPRLSDYRADGVFRMKSVYELTLDFT